MKFYDKIMEVKEESQSDICVGLDVAAFGTRLQFTIGKGEEKIEKILSFIEILSPYCCAFKVNRQYILDLTRSQIKEMTQQSHDFSRPIIIDHKLSDIGATNEQALCEIAKEGFDSFIFSPFPGNFKQISECADKYGLATIMLVLMSNPEAIWMITTFIDGIPMFQYYAQMAQKFTDGIVVGATNHVGEDELNTITESLSEKIILVPGIGIQGGNIEKVLKFFKNDALINIGRGIIYHENPVFALKKYNERISAIKAHPS